MLKQRIKNFFLVKRFPFLNPWRDESSFQRKGHYWYGYTWLDDIPSGWRNSFIMDMLKEIKAQLKKENALNEYSVIQTKEKYGSLRWYDNGSKEIADIVKKYEEISEKTCCVCGAPATKISTGWICPFCDECAEAYPGQYIDIN